MGFIIFIVVMIFVVPNIIDAVKKAERNEEYAREQEEQLRRDREEKQKEEEQKRRALQQQKDLVVRYKNSTLIQEATQAICNGDIETTPPEKIVITNNYIQGTNNGRTLTYDFDAHGIKSLPTVIKVVRGWDELQFVVKPQVAIADALNLLLNNRYVIQNISRQDPQRFTDSDGDSHTLITYTSDHVTMVLKSTLPNKEF